MNTLIKFLNSKPSYLKSSTTMIAAKAGVAESTVIRFKKSSQFKTMRTMYVNSLVK